jgi:N-acetylglucosamine-6-phosphate deacetylase
VDSEDWLMTYDMAHNAGVGVRIVTAAPEISGVLEGVGELTRRGIIFSLGHRQVTLWKSVQLNSHEPFTVFSIASTNIAATAVKYGARLITHLFNAMPQLHHRDPVN